MHFFWRSLLRLGLIIALPIGAAEAAPGGGACQRTLRPLVIPVDFSDVPRGIDDAGVRRAFLQEPDRYFREMSYGKVCLAGELARKWYRMPRPIADYWVPFQNLKVNKETLQNLLNDALARAEKDVDLTRYDFVIIVLGATGPQWGNQGLNTYPGLLGIASDSSLVTPGGNKVRGGVAMYARTARLGKIVHNIAHIIGGVKEGRRVLPDMYDQQTASASNIKAGPLAFTALMKAQFYMGAWDPMSCNMCLQRPGAPGFSMWTKLRLGWVDEDRVRTVLPGEAVELTLNASSEPRASLLAVRIPLSPTTYYLIENRQKVGYDRNAPSAGILILAADDAVAEPRAGRAPVRLLNANPSVPNLDGAAYEVGKTSSFSDAANGIDIRLIRRKGTSYDIRIERGP